MGPATALVVLSLLAVPAAALYQWVLDSPLLELGAASWFPAGGDLSAAKALARSAAASAAPLAATAVAALLVLVTPSRVWVRCVVGLLAVTSASSPVLAAYRYDVRSPTAEEAAAIVGLSDLDVGYSSSRALGTVP